MSIRVELGKISGGMSVVGYVEKESIVSFHYYDGGWTTGGSSCLPSNIEKAKLYVECYSQAMAKVQEIIDGGLV